MSDNKSDNNFEQLSIFDVLKMSNAVRPIFQVKNSNLPLGNFKNGSPAQNIAKKRKRKA